MSGHKKTLVSISEEEYKRLYESETKLKYLQRDTPDLVNKVKDQTRKLVGRSFDEVRTRQDQFHQYMEGISKELDSLEYQTDHAIESSQKHVIEAMDSRSNEVVDDVLMMLNDVVSLVDSSTTQAIHQHDLALADLARSMAEQSSRKSQIAERAVIYYQYSVGLYEYLQNEFPVLLEGHSGLQDAYNWLFKFEENYQFDAMETCLAIAQLAHQNLSRIRIETEVYLERYTTLKYVLTSQITELMALCHANREVQAIDFQGNELSTRLIVDDWTDQRVMKIEQHLTAIQNNLEHDVFLKEYEKLENLHLVTIPELVSRLEKAVLTCRVQAINSQIRVNIAEIILGAFTTQGYSLNTNGFKFADYLQGYQADFSSPDGTRITVHIDPLKGAVGKNELVLDTVIPEGTTEREVIHRAEELAKALSYSGLQTPGFSYQSPTRSSKHLPLPAEQKLLLD